MTTFVYIDYGPSPDIAVELKYSLSTLLYEYRGREPAVVVYTDKPAVYASLPANVRTKDLAPHFAAWTHGGDYAHRVKPCVLIDALANEDEICALVDSDTFIRRGFADALAERQAAGGVVMDHFERADPYSEASGFSAEIPGLGRYTYDAAESRMFNSGLVAARRRHIPQLEQAVALVDAFLDSGLAQFNIEQIAVSEAFRLAGEPISEIKPWFEHYYRRSQKLYMRPRIAALAARVGGWRPMAPALEPSKLNVRSAHIVSRLKGNA